MCLITSYWQVDSGRAASKRSQTRGSRRHEWKSAVGGQNSGELGVPELSRCQKTGPLCYAGTGAERRETTQLALLQRSDDQENKRAQFP